MSGRLQLYMWHGKRERLQRRHAFYCEQVKRRIFTQFENIESESEAHMEEEYERLGAIFSGGEWDGSAAGDMAQDSGLEFISLLSDLKNQTILGVLAGMYHQWEKELRTFIDSELTRDGVIDVRKYAWKNNVANVFEILTEFGWNCRDQSFFPPIEACNLVMNKNGTHLRMSLDHEWLRVRPDQFDGIAEAMTMFWKAFPERLFYTLP